MNSFVFEVAICDLKYGARLPVAIPGCVPGIPTVIPLGTDTDYNPHPYPLWSFS